MAKKKNKEKTRIHFDTDWKYDPAPESVEHIKVNKQYEHYIDGSWRSPNEGKYFNTVNPASGKRLARIASGSTSDIDDAVAAARKAFGPWSALPGKERGKWLFKLARQIQERAREFAVIESLDGGKPIRESKAVDIPLAAAHFFYHAGWADKLTYAFPGRNPEPLGVAGQIIPWNFPLLMAAWKLAPALATGNTVVLKPAETTPLTALKLAELIDDLGFPPGVINIVTGAGDTGAALVQHPDIDKIAFTGSTDVGKEIQKSIAGTGKKLTLELGGKAANIILEDAAIDQAVEGIINGIYFNQGHVCCAGSRLLVQESIESKVIKKLKDRMSTLVIGDPLDKNTDIGAINSRAQLKTIQKYIELGAKEGGEIFQCEGSLPDGKGFWCKPTLFTGLAQSSTLVKEEIFGPVLAVQSFRTLEEALTKANNTPYGLSAGVWTDKGAKIFKMTTKLKAGIIWANTYNKFDPASPFGGYKESGFGREGGLHGLSAYVTV